MGATSEAETEFSSRTPESTPGFLVVFVLLGL